MEQTSTMQAVGCPSALIALGGLIAGVYYGAVSEKGSDMGEAMSNALKYGPMIAGGLWGLVGGTIVSGDKESLEALASNANVPEEVKDKVKGCQAGCLPVVSGAVGTGMTGLATYVGYLTGSLIGKNI